ncbi:MAG: ATP-binding protein [Eubacteriales bacterium]
MKKRINTYLVLVAGLGIALTLLMTVSIFYNLFKTQVFDDLKTAGNILKLADELKIEDEEIYENVLNIMRITVIDSDGVVTYDSQADSSLMENHNNREEVIEAKESGEGKAIRKSDTLKTNMYYYAILLEDGNIFRVAKEAGSVWSIFIKATPAMMGIAFMLIIFSMIGAHFLVKNIIEPIEKISNNLDSVEKEDIYVELLPFIDTIQKQHKDIMKAARMRQDFTANVSHELKTPLTSISGYSELIESGMVPQNDVQRFAGEIRANATRLLTLINDIIRLSELDTPQENAPFEKINISQIAQTCVDMLQVNAENHQVSLSYWGDSCYVMSTKEMVEEVIYNLCDNAIRYNNIDGYVRVSVKAENNQVMLSVRDTGIGIPKKYQERVFERFYRVDKSRSKLTGGTGLGLAIVKHIVVQLGAKMDLISEEGKGTEIIVTFPEVNM